VARWQEADKTCKGYETYLPFTAREGRVVALAAIELFDVGVESQFEYLPHTILDNPARVGTTVFLVGSGCVAAQPPR